MRCSVILTAGACVLAAAQNDRIDVEDGSIPGLEDALREASESAGSIVESATESLTGSSSTVAPIKKPTFTVSASSSAIGQDDLLILFTAYKHRRSVLRAVH